LIKNNNRIDAIKAEMERIEKEGAEQGGKHKMECHASI